MQLFILNIFIYLLDNTIHILDNSLFCVVRRIVILSTLKITLGKVGLDSIIIIRSIKIYLCSIVISTNVFSKSWKRGIV